MKAFNWSHVEGEKVQISNVLTEDLFYSPLLQHRSGIYKDDQSLIVSAYMINFDGRMHRLYNCRDGGLTMYFNPNKSGISGDVILVKA